jgi:DNA end-binding protein Ku
MFEDEEKKRILAAIDEKIAGRQIVAHAPPEEAAGGAQVIDLVEALRASLGKAAAPAKKAAPAAKAAAPAAPAETSSGKERKGVKRAAKVEEAVAPARTRARK